MSDIIYRPLIEDMTWSYSRIKCFEDCPYRWFLLYIKNMRQNDMFYSSYGSFVHDLLARYYYGLITADGMEDEFISEFKNRVKGERPDPKIVTNYISDAVRYFESFKPLPYETVAVEKKYHFSIGCNRFVGIIDHLGMSEGGTVITDHKSKTLKKRSGRAKPTMGDAELDDMLRQLYIYSAALYETTGQRPKMLCFNSFRTGNLIEEPFRTEAYDEAISWAKNKIEEIKATETFLPHPEYFKCRWLCGVNDRCCYYDFGR